MSNLTNLENILIIYIGLNWLTSLLIISVMPSGKVTKTIVTIALTILNPLLVLGYALISFCNVFKKKK